MASVNKSDAYKCLIINNKILYIKRSSSKNMQVKWVHHNLYVIKQALIVQFPIYFDSVWVLRTNLKSIYKIVYIKHMLLYIRIHTLLFRSLWIKHTKKPQTLKKSLVCIYINIRHAFSDKRAFHLMSSWWSIV